MDGMHRVCKAFMTGEEKIKAVQFDVDPEPDAAWTTTYVSPFGRTKYTMPFLNTLA
jgi:hypothetical protein